MAPAAPDRTARAFPCATCGAPSELSSGARCPYCGAARPKVQAAVQANAAEALMEVQVAVMQGAQRAAEAHRKRAPLQVGLMLGGVGIAMFVSWQHTRGLARGADTGPGGALLFGAFALCALGVSAFTALRGKQRARLAALPLAHPGGPEHALCPSCGAALPVHGDSPTVRCGHCRVESLLPVSALSARMELRQRSLLAERQRATVAGASSMRLAIVLSVIVFAVMLVASGLSLALGAP